MLTNNVTSPNCAEPNRLPISFSCHSLTTIDGVGALFGWFGVGTLVFGLALFAKWPWAKNWLADRWRWMVIPLICLGGIYLPVYVMPVDQRYFYLFLPLVMILTLGLFSPMYVID